MTKPKAKKRGTARTPKKVGVIVLAPETHSDADKARALVAYRTTATVKAACEAALIGRTTWYQWRKVDPAFDRLARDAEEDVADMLEATAIARATAAEAPSDTLIIFLLKSLRRERFGDRQTVTVVHPDVVDRLRRQAGVIGSRESWTSAELFAALELVWA